MAEQQSFKKHTKWVSGYHGFVLPALLLNAGWSVWRWAHAGFTVEGLVSLLAAFAVLLLAFYARVFALTVQDRVIRLEERLRLEKLLPDDLKFRIGEFTPGQLVGLRFASDSELPTIARKVLADKLTDRKAVKQLVQNWRPDNLRA